MITKIDNAKCTGCGICVDRCPLDTLRLNTAVSEVPPCQAACPAGIDIRGYMYLVKMGLIHDAMRLIKESLPFPAITGRVCFHPCELKCARNDVDETVNIKSLERFVVDYWLEENVEPVPRLHVGQVAIVGSGPAGLSAAYFLTKMGYRVTVFESMPAPGGMLRYGIPEYRLPKDILDSEINYMKDMGVEFRTGTTIGKDMTIAQLKDGGFKAILIAIGTNKSLKLSITGEELKGVYSGLDFLRDVNSGKKVDVGEKVVIVGGGNVAIDSARTAVRLGAKEVLIIYRRSRQEMPANDEEVKKAEDEGVKMDYLTAPIRILGRNGVVESVECCKVEPGKADAGRRKSPAIIKGTEFVINANMVISAIGEAPDLAFVNDDGKLGITSRGTIKVDAENLTTGIPGVFAGGDAVNGPSSVVEAIASGKRRAVSIDRYLKREEPKAVKKGRVTKVNNLPGEGIEEIARLDAPSLPIQQRIPDFQEVETGYTEEMTLNEVRRCMTCGSRAYIAHPDDCMTCFECELQCPSEAIYVHPFKEVLLGPIDILLGGKHG